MTLQELTRHLKLREQKDRNEQIIESLRAAAEGKPFALTGMPRAPGIKDRVGDLAVEIADMQAEIDRLTQSIDDDEMRILAYIESVDDAQTRTILRLRFIRCLPWKTVASLMGGNNSADGVKTICYRYLSG